MPPHRLGSQTGAMFGYLIVMAILVRTFITMYEIPSSAMVPEMTDDYNQRTTFISVRYVFAIAAGVIMNCHYRSSCRRRCPHARSGSSIRKASMR